MLFILLLISITNADYCDAPLSTVEPLEGYNHKLLQIVFRHGDRSPWATYEGDKANYECGVTQQLRFLSVQGMESYEFAHVRTHIDKERNPYAKHYYGGSCQNGQLTRKGLNQLANLGESVRKAFVGENKLLPEYLNEDDIYVRSTHVWRVIQSAESFLKSLYPSNKRNPSVRIPVNILPSEIDYATSNTGRCPRISQLENEMFTKYFVNELKLREQEPYKSLLDKCERHFGPATYKWYDAYFDILEELRCNGLEYPCFDVVDENGQTKQECFTEEDEKLISKLVDSDGVYRFFDNETIPMARLHSGLYLGDILQAQKDKIEGKHAKKYMHYHAHDTTIYPMVSLLEGDYSQWPPYASWIMLELYEKEGKYYVRGHYNDKQLPFDFCEKNADGLCTWESFYNHLVKKVPTKEQCQKQ